MRSTTGRHDGVLGVGVLGLGTIGLHHLRAAQASVHGTVTGMCDVDEASRARARELADAPVYANFDELLESEAVDVISVCLPHDLHALFAEQALAAGKHVLVEKPLALTVTECDALVRASTRYGRSLGVSHNELFYPAHERAKALIASRELGKPLLLRLRLAADGPYGGWRSNTAHTGGGILFDAGVHRLYVALALFGEISEVHALLDRSQKDGEQFALLGLSFASGARGIVEANFLSPDRYFDDSIEIVCSAGGLVIAGIESQYVGFRSGPPLLRFEDGRWREEDVAAGGWEESIDRSVDAFLASVANNLPPPVSALDGRKVIALLEEIYLKAELWGGRER
jgi:predicted dehydrogenase